MKHPRRQLAALIFAVSLLASAASAISTRSLQGSRVAVVRVERGLLYGTAGGQRLLLDAYLPSEKGQRRPAVIFVHGGGWRSGDKTAFAPGEQTFAPTATRLVELGFAVFSVDYRLAPAARYPAAVDDIATAIRWIRANAGRFGVDPPRLGLFGASAGGNLAALAATRGRGRLDTGARVRAVVSWSGPMDLTLFDAELGGPSTAPVRRELHRLHTHRLSRPLPGSLANHSGRSKRPTNAARQQHRRDRPTRTGPGDDSPTSSGRRPSPVARRAG